VYGWESGEASTLRAACELCSDNNQELCTVADVLSEGPVAEAG
jgi:hypothetical protein